MSYELPFIARVTSYFLYTSYKLPFIARVKSKFLQTSYELPVRFYIQFSHTSYFLHMSHKFLIT